MGDVFKPAERVLICYDGSPSSVALINLSLNAMVFGNEEVGRTGKLPFPFKFAILVLLGMHGNTYAYKMLTKSLVLVEIDLLSW